MDLLLRGGRVVDTSTESVRDGVHDVLIRDGLVAHIGDEVKAESAEKVKIVDVSGKVVCPGLIDLHVHFRDPGLTHKEDIVSGGKSAAAGGFTSVCVMPNTSPVNDNARVTQYMLEKARGVDVRVFPIGAITKGSSGTEIAAYAAMKKAGIVAISDDGHPVMHGGLMRRALEYARTFDLCVVQHCEDLHIAEGGHMHEGHVSRRLGVPAQPAAAETSMIARDLELVELTGARYHVAHLSTARGVDLVRDAKRRGLPVTCEVTPHHFILTEEHVSGFATLAKMKPPLRLDEDVEALIVGMADGTIDCIATDHAPHHIDDKQSTFCCAAPGLIGLETSLALTLELVRRGRLELSRAIELLTSGPAQVFGLSGGCLRVGEPADVCVFDPDALWQLDETTVMSKSGNSPFLGMQLQGRPWLTMLGGRVTHDLEGALQ